MISESAGLDFTFPIQQRSSAVSAKGAEVREFYDAAVVVEVDSYTDGETTLSLVVSNDGSTWQAPEPQEQKDLVIDGSSDTGTHYLDYNGRYPYVGVESSTTGTTSGATWGAAVMKANAQRTPIR